MAELGLKEGDLVEVYNENGSTQAMVYPTPTAKRKEAFMQFGYLPSSHHMKQRAACSQRQDDDPGLRLPDCEH